MPVIESIQNTSTNPSSSKRRFVGRTSRTYAHNRCRGVTEIDGIHFAVLANPVTLFAITYCAVCEDNFPVTEFRWADSSEPLPEYYDRHLRSLNAGLGWYGRWSICHHWTGHSKRNVFIRWSRVLRQQLYSQRCSRDQRLSLPGLIHYPIGSQSTSFLECNRSAS